MPRKKSAELTHLTPEELEIFLKCAKSPFEFSKYVMLIHVQRGKIPFALYPFQKATLRAFLKNPFNVILKFRQAGVTELISMFCLWFAMFHSFKNIVIISIKDRVAKKVLRKIKFMYKNLPEFLKIGVINGRGEDLGTSCVTPETVLVGEYRDFPIGEITPRVEGILDVTKMDLRVLTHSGTFERITHTINKGILETWEIENERGKILKCTPQHRLYTIRGWKTVQEIVEKNIPCIYWDTQYLDDIKSPITKKPKKEIIKETRFKGYYISNWGRVYSSLYRIKEKGKGRGRMGYGENLKLLRTRISGHERIKLKGSGNNKQYSVHRLMWETFNGPIPDGYVVDHIDCVKSHNWLSNFQCITFSQNTCRSYKYSRVLVNNNYTIQAISLKALGKLRYLSTKIGTGYGTGKIIADKLGMTTKSVSHYRRHVAEQVYTSRIKVNRVYTNIIVDLQIENNHSYITKSHYINHNTELEFSNGSIISSIPTTEDAGRGEAVALLVIDEAAIVRWAERIWAAAWPTLSTGGRAIINSTAYGVGNFFHKLFTSALAGGNTFNPIRLHWQMHPERDLNWYKEQYEVLGPRKTAQEIDGDFLTSGNTVFDLADIREIEELVIDGIEQDGRSYRVIKSKLNGQLKIYEEPIPGVKYFLGADIATGRSQDFSTICVMDKWGDEKLSFKGKIPIDQMEDLIFKYGKLYNWAIAAPESNDIGLGVAMGLQKRAYKNLYYSKRYLKEKGENKVKVDVIPGWYTTKKNRPIMIAMLEEDIRNRTCYIKCQYMCVEAYTFIYDERNRPVAMNKHKANSDSDIADDDVYSDDSIFAHAICNYIRKEKNMIPLTLPK